MKELIDKWELRLEGLKVAKESLKYSGVDARLEAKIAIITQFLGELKEVLSREGKDY